MYARTGSLIALEGRGPELAEILLRAADAVDELDGSVQYLVGFDQSAADAVVVLEVWESAEAHASSLGDPTVRSLIAEAQPLIAAMDAGIEARLIGGLGL